MDSVVKRLTRGAALFVWARLARQLSALPNDPLYIVFWFAIGGA